METEFFEFHWKVAKEGYRVIENPNGGSSKNQPKFFLINARRLGQEPSTPQVYQPMQEYPELFSTFAEIDVTQKESVLAFANKYGLLKEGGGSGISRTRNQELVTIGEPLSLWDKEIKAMREAVDLRRTLERMDLKGLSQLIQWDGKDSVWFKSYEITSRTNSPILLEWFPPGDVVLPARYCLANFINRHLFGHVTTRLLWTPSDRWKLPKQRIQLAPDFRVVPCDLLGVLWIEFALVIAGEREYRQCQTCGKPIVVGGGPGTARAHKQTCSPACRIALFRKRKREKSPAHQRLTRKRTAKRA